MEAIAAALESGYIYEDRGRAIATELRERAAAGAYAEVASAPDLAERITRDLYKLSSDAHLRADDNPARLRPRVLDRTHGFRAAEVLEGNVGYLDLRGFVRQRRSPASRRPGARASGRYRCADPRSPPRAAARGWSRTSRPTCLAGRPVWRVPGCAG